MNTICPVGAKFQLAGWNWWTFWYQVAFFKKPVHTFIGEARASSSHKSSRLLWIAVALARQRVSSSPSLVPNQCIGAGLHSFLQESSWSDVRKWCKTCSLQQNHTSLHTTFSVSTGFKGNTVAKSAASQTALILSTILIWSRLQSYRKTFSWRLLQMTIMHMRMIVSSYCFAKGNEICRKIRFTNAIFAVFFYLRRLNRCCYLKPDEMLAKE